MKLKTSSDFLLTLKKNVYSHALWNIKQKSLTHEDNTQSYCLVVEI